MGGCFCCLSCLHRLFCMGWLCCSSACRLTLAVATPLRCASPFSVLRCVTAHLLLTSAWRRSSVLPFRRAFAPLCLSMCLLHNMPLRWASTSTGLAPPPCAAQTSLPVVISSRPYWFLPLAPPAWCHSVAPRSPPTWHHFPAPPDLPLRVRFPRCGATLMLPLLGSRCCTYCHPSNRPTASFSCPPLLPVFGGISSPWWSLVAARCYPFWPPSCCRHGAAWLRCHLCRLNAALVSHTGVASLRDAAPRAPAALPRADVTSHVVVASQTTAVASPSDGAKHGDFASGTNIAGLLVIVCRRPLLTCRRLVSHRRGV